MRTTRTIRAEVPVEVWDRLAAEAAQKGVPLGRYLRDLIVKRDAKKHKVSGNAVPVEAGSATNPTGARPSTGE